MATPVRLYQDEMHKNLGYFATWLPSDPIRLGDIGILEGGRFRRQGSLEELGIHGAGLREGIAEDMSYSASAERTTGVSAGASAAVPVAKAEFSIKFSRQGGYVFEALGIRSAEFGSRLALAEQILGAHDRGQWQDPWLVVDSVYTAASATIIVSEASSSEIVLKASGNVPIGSLPLADPKLGLTVTASNGKIVHLVARNNLSPLYSCMKVHNPLFGSASLVPVRGLESGQALLRMTRLGINDLLDS
jgi:hypothetical protein